MENARILVTGAQGFVGRHLCRELIRKGFVVRALVRKRNPQLLPKMDSTGQSRFGIIETGDLLEFADWPAVLRDVQAVVHLVARTHTTNEFGLDALEQYRAINVDVTRRLAEAATSEGVQHFVYMSSVKAIANESSEPLCEHAPCLPADSYGVSKLEAEQTLKQTLADASTSYTILRPPMVYGVGVKGNFLRLMRLIRRGIPMPNIDNQRSIVHLENLVSAVVRSLNSPAAKNEVFHVTDGEPISTTELVNAMGAGFGTKARLVPVPQLVLSQLGRVVGRHEEVQRLTGSLTMSTDKIETVLDWQPTFGTVEGVARTCRAFLSEPWEELPTTDAIPYPRRAA